jgi:uncharacterized membrane protein YdjX (TVP38/TMEM64 family)
MRKSRIAAVAAVAVTLLVLQRLGVFETFSAPERVKQTMLGLGPWGYAVFVVAYAALQPFGVPGTVFVVAAPLIWSWPIAYALSMTGTMAASVVGFSFTRFVARDWVSKRIPARFRRYDETLARRGFATVFLLRFVFWMPQLLHAFFGVSNVRFSTHFWGSLAGYAVPLFFVSYFGERIFDTLKTWPVERWIAVGVGAAVLWLTIWLVRRRASRGPAP